MTKSKKPITAENAKKSSSKTSEKPVKSEAEQLLETTKLEPQPQITEPQKAKRGRPPKKVKPTWDKAKYHDNVIAKTINDTLITVLNKTVTKEDKILENEIEIGEAITYALDYYMEEIPLTHPLIILLFASIGLGIVVIKKHKKPEKTEQKEEDKYTKLAREMQEAGKEADKIEREKAK